MAFTTPKLKKFDNGVKYSQSEQRIFALLSSKERITTKELTRKFYGNKVPLNGATIVGGTLRSLMRKAKHNKEQFKIRRSERRGPHPMEVWLDV